MKRRVEEKIAESLERANRHNYASRYHAVVG